MEYVAEDGTIVAHREYDPFGGTVVYAGNANAFTHWFSTKPWCTATGLSEYQYRKYSPVMGRWMSKDPIGEKGGHNRHAFVLNNPIVWIDPDGLSIEVLPGEHTYDSSNISDPFQLTSAGWRYGSEWMMRNVLDGFREIIGDCAKLSMRPSGWVNLTIANSHGCHRTYRRRKFEVVYSDEKKDCICDPCWQLLKKAIDSSTEIQIRYLSQSDNAFAYAEGNPRDVYINPNVDVELPEADENGNYEDMPTPFSIVLWHESIGHAGEGQGHPYIPQNTASGWDGSYIDPTIEIENLGRECTRSQDRRYGGFLGIGGHLLGPRAPTYY
jgi:RHS repeat-associated protein